MFSSSNVAKFFTCVTLITAIFLTSVHPASALVTSVTNFSIDTLGASRNCTVGGYSFSLSFTFTTYPGSVSFGGTLTDGNRNVIGSVGGGGGGGTKNGSGGGGGSFSGATARPFTVTLYDASDSKKASLGSFTFDPATYDTDCTKLPYLAQTYGYFIPHVPADFVLRTITCNTVVYTQAGGVPVATGSQITNGQTWYVSPTPVTIGDTNWTEIYVGSRTDPFIPTACVGDKPAGYSGN